MTGRNIIEKNKFVTLLRFSFTSTHSVLHGAWLYNLIGERFTKSTLLLLYKCINDGNCYTRMLRCVKQIHWERHVTNLELYGGLPRVSTKIRARRLRLAGHCLRHAELAANKLVLWAPTQGHCSRGRPQTTYVDTLCRDSGLRLEELRIAMEDQCVWRAINRCSASTEWIIL